MKRARPEQEVRPWGDLGPDTIGFRLDYEHRRLLCEQAKAAGMTPHAFARVMLVRALRQPERISAIERSIKAIQETIPELADRVDQVRSDLATVAQALLVAAGGMSQSDAQKLVTKFFHPD